MHEHIQRTLYYCEVHLLFASMVFCVAWMVTSVERGSATAKYWIWVATLANFILPLGALLDRLFAPHLGWATPVGLIGGVGVGLAQNFPVAAVWSAGALFMFTRLYLRLQSDRCVEVAADRPCDHSPYRVHGIPVAFAGGHQAPAVSGVLRPCILLPEGIDRMLSRPELDAVLIHEVTHARRRDNLIRLICEIARCLLWFHPFVWITGSRLSLYRELSCDEAVIEEKGGRDLILALAKLARPEKPALLQASASSLLGHRLALLSAQPRVRSGFATVILCGLFAVAFLGGVLATVAHTACCFVTHS